ncbi:MAG: hypothetical protein JWP69_57 [Flaviaesturariibacter sp.]|nr:hypothetical protein [Flaviaesturariibacter sp.]
MPNHVHLLLYYKQGERSLNLEVGSAKRFIAYEIVKRLAASGEGQLLEGLAGAVEAKDRSRGKKHEVWEDSFDVKECNTEKYMLQKLNYIHNNPCTGKWKLSMRPVGYLHSSAAFYAGQKHGYAVRDYLDILVELADRSVPPSSAKEH